jgi:hypothetical protein
MRIADEYHGRIFGGKPPKTGLFRGSAPLHSLRER